MRVYNVEVYDPKFNFRSHTNVMSLDYNEDYLTPENNKIIVEKIDANVGDYLLITNGDYEFFGRVTGTSSESKDTINISYKPFISLLDLDVLFDVNLQNKDSGTALEDYIAATIQELFVSNADTSMTVPHITSTITSHTSKWNLGLVSDEETSHYCISNLLKNIVIKAFEAYSIRIFARFNPGEKMVYLSIGTNNAPEVTIEADFPNISSKNISVRQNDVSVNKVIVYNSENYTDKIIFYRHTNDTFSIVDTDRVVPVVQETYAVAPVYEEDVVVESFAERALQQAEEAFAMVEYDNFIELTMAIDDSLYHPMSMEVGQVVNVISGDKQYRSILSGVNISNTITLVFGLIRVDLTKQIWRSSYGY